MKFQDQMKGKVPDIDNLLWLRLSGIQAAT